MSNDINEIVVEEPYGFIYITTNMVNGKRYIGQKKFDNKWKDYLGSGNAFKNAIKKYGKENFERNIIDLAYSEEELNQKEYEYSVFFNVVESHDWYNLVLGGGTSCGWHPSEETKRKIGEGNKKKLISNETRQKISRSKKGKYIGKNNPNYGNHKLAGEKNHMYGKHHSDETKEKISIANKGKNSGINNKSCNPVYCIELDELFWGQTEASKKYNINCSCIGDNCRGRQKTAGKHPKTRYPLHWKYVYDFKRKDGLMVDGAITLGYVTQQQVDNYLNSIKEERT